MVLAYAGARISSKFAQNLLTLWVLEPAFARIIIRNALNMLFPDEKKLKKILRGEGLAPLFGHLFYNPQIRKIKLRLSAPRPKESRLMPVCVACMCKSYTVDSHGQFIDRLEKRK